MRQKRKVVLALGAERKSGRAILRGIARFATLHVSWLFETEPPFYGKYPYSAGVDRRERALARLGEMGADGVIAFAVNKAEAKAFIPARLPSVIIPVEETIPGRCSIMEERYAVGAMAAEHLLNRGFKQFAYCGLNQTYWSRVREEGFAHRLAQAGFAPDIYRAKKPPSQTTWGAEQHRMAAWLRALPKPVGLMAFNDERAQQVLEAGKLVDVRVPDEIAVIGVDDDDIICDLADPPLSSIAMDFENVGHEAARQLHRQMEGREPSIWEIRQRPTHIVTRQSTDILAIEDESVADALRFIRNHAADMITVQDVVNAASVSRRLLERHFQLTLGRSVHKEIQRVHVERACELLLRTEWPLRQVAEKAGFSGPVHLGVAFKRVMKLTPQGYRDQNMVKKSGGVRRSAQ